MEYQVSARKYRPQSFEDVVGQAHVARTLTNAIRQGRLAQAYLFSGTRGVGKTTLARILAKAVNCASAASGPTITPCQTCESCAAITSGHSPDVIEIDGASNRGIDEVRELREMIKYAPMGGRRKIYIIDEVHMLTKEAFNALLKTLEEPPPHVIFVFATTEDHKVPTTILSRCQHFHFKRITRQEIMEQLERILRGESIRISRDGLSLIAKAADGSLRDALSLLDQAVAYGGKEVADSDLEMILGTAGRAPLLAMLRMILERKTDEALRQLKALSDQGLDPRQFASELVEYLRHLVIARTVPEPDELIDLPSEEVEEIRRLSALAGVEELQRLFGVFSSSLEGFRGAVQPGFVLEMAVIRSTRIQPLESFEKLLERLDRLEPAGGEAAPGRPAAPVRSAPPSPGPPAKAAEGFSEGGSMDRAERLTETAREPAADGPATGSAPAESHAASAAEAGELKDQWGAVLRRVVSQRPHLGAYLEKGEVQGLVRGGPRDLLVIGFQDGSSFLVDLIQRPENQSAISAALEEVFHKPVQMKIVRMERSAREQEEMRRQQQEQEQQQRRRVKQEGLAHPLVKDALDILGGEVIDIKEH